jgi:Flp pilus assembly protein TadB
VGSIIIMVLAFTAASLVVCAVNLVITDIAQRDRKRMNERLQEQIRKQQKQDLRKQLEHKDLSELAKEAFEENASERLTFAQKFRYLIEQSGLRITPQKLQFRMGVSAVVVG